MESATIKVFAMNDCDWMAAASLEEAVEAYKLDYLGDENPDPEMIEDAHEVSAEAMHRLRFTDTEVQPPVTRTFAEQLALEIAQGREFPCFFASTEY